jgi:hypothetical protein
MNKHWYDDTEWKSEEFWRGKKNSSLCRFAHHKSNKDWSDIELVFKVRGVKLVCVCVCVCVSMAGGGGEA